MSTQAMLAFLVVVVFLLQLALLLRGRNPSRGLDPEIPARLARAEAQAERIGPLEQQLNMAREESSTKRAELAAALSRCVATEQALATANEQLASISRATEALVGERNALAEANARLEQEVRSTRQREAETDKLLADAKEAMAKEFRLAASTLLEEKGAKLNEQQKSMLSDLLAPFSKTLDDFKGKVEATREADLTARESLIAQIRHLTELNQDIGAKAQSLTNALLGESKTRGIWGEAVLQRILELAGLREGVGFRTQASHHDEDSEKRLVPDVVLDLPQERAIVIDAKVSLVAYERYVSASDEEAKALAISEHATSVRRHINDLSKKNYPALYQLKSVDFTLLFVPIESALMAASEADPDLAQYALERGVALVSPNTLFTVLRTVEYIWRVEKTTRNMEEIVKRGGLMYNAAAQFAEHVTSISDALGKATHAVQSAEKALKDPSRGLVRQAERLRELGIKPKRAMPKRLSPDVEEADAASMEQIGSDLVEDDA
ncbi:MAG TPA: DNA recombination protein RmuC [Frateuria sp.]|uniref:DNA recombination protein RmuC n=1 Tax=Frateuria sp. TaxID=2211372 RepID=UPI002DF713FA|nr:DNA recombination protein RmuC [Frateuria sp.]